MTVPRIRACRLGPLDRLLRGVCRTAWLSPMRSVRFYLLSRKRQFKGIQAPSAVLGRKREKRFSLGRRCGVLGLKRQRLQKRLEARERRREHRVHYRRLMDRCTCRKSLQRIRKPLRSHCVAVAFQRRPSSLRIQGEGNYRETSAISASHGALKRPSSRTMSPAPSKIATSS